MPLSCLLRTCDLNFEGGEGLIRKLRSIIQARQRRVLRPSLTRIDPVWPFEVTEIIEITYPPGDLFIRRL